MVIDAEGRCRWDGVATAARRRSSRANIGPTTPRIRTPHDFVVVINAAKVKLTGKKLEEKVYYRHTEWPGGIRTTTAGKILESEEGAAASLSKIAVRGMLPKNRLGRRLYTKLKVYAGRSIRYRWYSSRKQWSNNWEHPAGRRKYHLGNWAAQDHESHCIRLFPRRGHRDRQHPARWRIIFLATPRG